MPVAAVVVPPLEVVPPDFDPVVEVEPVVVPFVLPVPVVPVVPVVLVPPVVVVLPVVVLVPVVPVVPVVLVPVVVVVLLAVVPVVFVPVVLVAFVEELVRPDVLPAPPCAVFVFARVVAVRAPPTEEPVELESSSCSVSVSEFEEPLLVLEELPVLVLELPLDCPESELALLFVPSTELADPSDGSVVLSQASANPSSNGMGDNRVSLSRKIMHYSFQ